MGEKIVGSGLSGALANQKEGGTTAGNAYLNPNQIGGLQQTMQQGISNQQVFNQDATKNVQNNGILGGLFGQGGTLDQTIQQESQQANQPWALTADDRSSYGQASGDISRMFGQSEQSLGQSLSDRGLSNSGIAGAAFSGLQGNKQEQLAGLQTQIANNRQQMNQQKLNSTRNFLSQLGGQANTAINSEHDRGMSETNQYNKVLQDKARMAGGMLGAYQDQENEGLKQQQQTQHASTFANTVNGTMQGKDQADAQVGSAAKSVGTKM